MFRREDYWPYLSGIFVFAGLIIIPLLLEKITGGGYDRNVWLSLAGCFIFAFAHKRNGKFLIGRFIGGLALFVLVSLRASLQAAKKGNDFQIIIPGLLAFLIMWGCGWLGIIIARVLGISKTLVTPASQAEPAFDYSVDMGGTITPMDVKSIDLTKEPGDSPFIKFMTSTYNNWKRGQLDSFATYLRIGANLLAFDKFCSDYKYFYQHIHTAHKLRPFEEDEYLIPTTGSQFLMTSKAIYIFQPANMVILNKDITEYEIKKHFWSEDGNDMYFTLHSGKKLAFKRIIAVVEKKYVDKFKDVTED